MPDGSSGSGTGRRGARPALAGLALGHRRSPAVGWVPGCSRAAPGQNRGCSCTTELGTSDAGRALATLAAATDKPPACGPGQWGPAAAPGPSPGRRTRPVFQVPVGGGGARPVGEHLGLICHRFGQGGEGDGGVGRGSGIGGHGLAPLRNSSSLSEQGRDHFCGWLRYGWEGSLHQAVEGSPAMRFDAARLRRPGRAVSGEQ